MAVDNLATLAIRLNAAHRAVEAGMRDSLERAVEAGELLTEAKSKLPHGEWIPWVRENFGGSHDMANRYMLIARRAPELEGNYARVRNLSIRAAVKMLTRDGNRNGDAEPAENPAPAVLPVQENGKLPGTVATLEELIAAGHKFGTVYADPPWQYGNQATRAATDNHYPTMTNAAIAALPVAQLAAADAHLHLWTTNAFLPESFAIIEAWGFTYKSVQQELVRHPPIVSDAHLRLAPDQPAIAELADAVKEVEDACAGLMSDLRVVREAAGSILDELEDRYDGAPASTTLWMREHMDRLGKALGRPQ